MLPTFATDRERRKVDPEHECLPRQECNQDQEKPPTNWSQFAEQQQAEPDRRVDGAERQRRQNEKPECLEHLRKRAHSKCCNECRCALDEHNAERRDGRSQPVKHDICEGGMAGGKTRQPGNAIHQSKRRRPAAERVSERGDASSASKWRCIQDSEFPLRLEGRRAEQSGESNEA